MKHTLSRRAFLKTSRRALAAGSLLGISRPVLSIAEGVKQPQAASGSCMCSGTGAVRAMGSRLR